MQVLRRFHVHAFAVLAATIGMLVAASAAHAAIGLHVLNTGDTGETAVTAGTTATITSNGAITGRIVSKQRLAALFTTHDSVVLAATGVDGDILLTADVTIPAGKRLVLQAQRDIRIEHATIAGTGTLVPTPGATLLISDSTIGAAIDQTGQAARTTSVADSTLTGAAKFVGQLTPNDATFGALAVDGDVRLEGDALLTRATTIGTAQVPRVVGGAFALRGTASSSLEMFGSIGLGGAWLSSVALEGTTTLHGGVGTSGPQTYGGAVTLAKRVDLDGSSITFNGALDTADGTQVLNIVDHDVLSFNGPVGATKPLNLLSLNAMNVRLASSFATTHHITFQGNVTLAGDTSVTTSNGAIEFRGTVDGAYALGLQASANVLFQQSVGATTPLASITSTGTAPVTFQQQGMQPLVGATTGAQTYGGELNANGVLTFRATDFTVTGAFKGYQADVAASGATVFADTANLNALTTSGGGTTRIGGTAQSFNGTIAIMDDLLLTADLTVFAGNGVTFGGKIDGAYKLTTASQRGVSFGGSIGSDTPLTNLELFDPQTPLTFASPVVRMTGPFQPRAARVTLAGDTNFEAPTIFFTGTIDGPHALGAHGSFVQFDQPLGKLDPLGSIDVHGTMRAVIKGDVVHTIDAQSYAGILQLDAPLATITSDTAGAQFHQVELGGLFVYGRLDVATDSSIFALFHSVYGGGPNTAAVWALTGPGEVAIGNVVAQQISMSVENGRLVLPPNGFNFAMAPVHLSGAGTLAGHGMAKTIVAEGGRLAPGSADRSQFGFLIAADDVTLDSDSVVDLDLRGGNEGIASQQGSVALNGAKLELHGNVDHLREGDAATIVQSMHGVTGTFGGLAEGDVIQLGSAYLRISYTGYGGRIVTLTRIRYASTTALTIPIATQAAGMSLTITAKVGVTRSDALDGEVTFSTGGTKLGAAPVVNGMATYTTTDLAVGTHQLTAHYGGNDSYGESTSAVVAYEVIPMTVVEPPVTGGGYLPTPPPAEAPKAAPRFDLSKPFASASCLRAGSKRLSFSFSTNAASTVTFQLQRKASGVNRVPSACTTGDAKGEPGSASSFVSMRTVAQRYAKAGRYKVTLAKILGKRPLIAGRYKVIARAVNPSTGAVDTVTYQFVVLPTKG